MQYHQYHHVDINSPTRGFWPFNITSLVESACFDHVAHIVAVLTIMALLPESSKYYNRTLNVLPVPAHICPKMSSNYELC